MASLTLNASHMNLKSTTNSAIRTSPALISLNTTRPIISFPKAKPHQLGLQRHVVSSSAMAETADKHYYDDILSKPSLSSLEPPLKVAIVGFGNFGQFIAKGLSRQGHVVLATSRSDYSDYCERHGFSFFRSMDEMCAEQPDIVLICSSILSMETVVRAIPLHKLRRDTIFADVLSVKQFPRNLFLEVLPPEFGIVCTHPMFGPESGKHGWNGLPFVYENVRISEGEQAQKCAQFLSIFEKEGCRMVEMSCEEHDRHAAGSQFITHTIGRILSHLNLESTPINTKGYETLLQLTDNTVSDSFDLYYGLFMYNVNATEQIDNLDRAFETVKQKLFGRLHDLLRKQIVERVPMRGTATSMKEAKPHHPYFLQNEEMKDLSSFAIPPTPQEERIQEVHPCNANNA